jgi:hemerythrin superfamily protein
MTTISQEIKKNHRELEGYHNSMVKSDDPDERMRFQNMFTWELARHSVSEELIVYPAFEKYLKDGSATAEKGRRQHQVVSSVSVFTQLEVDQKSHERAWSHW